MSDDPFPNVRDKLTAPTKKSAFEKSRLEAEAKRLREEAETAAVLKDFVASFDEPSPPPSLPSLSAPRGSTFRRGGGAVGRRHFTSGGGGGGSGGSVGGGLGTGGLGGGGVGPRKRTLDAAFEREEEVAGVFGGGEREKRRTGVLGWEGGSGSRAAEDDSDDEASKPHPKPTLSLTSLPPATTKTTLTSLLSTLPTPLRLDSIRLIPAPPPPGPSQPSPSIRKAASALITLSPETPSSEIDAAVTALNGRYLGSGFYLSISRHLPSTISSNPLPTSQSSNPFGAQAPVAGRRPPAAVHRGGFAPPASFRQGVTPQGLQVVVTPPADLKLLRLIHKTLEALLTHGPAFEALLMGSESVKADQRFAWLWDARSPAGVYYRWKLYSLVTGQKATPAVEVFEPTAAHAALWIPPRRPLRYEWASSIVDVREDEGFEAQELVDEEEEEGNNGEEKRGYLGVLGRAKLVHLVARIPTTTSKVRRGDIGRVMAFAMEHAEGGMGEEVVDVLVSNVLKPLAFTAAARPDGEDSQAQDKDKETQEETHGAKIIGLWIISDVLSNSSLGIRNAWRYRQLFDTALRERNVFGHLGEVYRTPGWGRMKAEKFRRGVVEGVLEWWEKWCIFPQTTQDAFLSSFLSTTTPTASTAVPTTQAPIQAPAPQPQTAPKSKWKTVDTTPSAFNPALATTATTADDEDIDGEPMADDSDIDGEPMPDEDEDVDGEPMPEDDEVDGEPMVEDEEEDEDEDLKEMFDDGAAGAVGKVGLGSGSGSGSGSVSGAAGGARKRMRAEDMFADED